LTILLLRAAVAAARQITLTAAAAVLGLAAIVSLRSVS
jgi:hypothetical protein